MCIRQVALQLITKYITFHVIDENWNAREKKILPERILVLSNRLENGRVAKLRRGRLYIIQRPRLPSVYTGRINNLEYKKKNILYK